MDGADRSGTDADSLAHQKWAFERQVRERELMLREREVRGARWSNPLVLALLGATAAGAANLALAGYNGRQQALIESAKAEQAMVLEMIKTNGDVEKAAENLRFLVSTALLTDPRRRAGIETYLNNRKKGTGPTLASSGAAVPQRFDFPVANRQPVDPAGWSVDVFACTAAGAQYAAARAFEGRLAQTADAKAGLAGRPLGRVRFEGGPQHRVPGNIVYYDPPERDVATALAVAAKRVTGRTFALVPNPGAATYAYLAIYFCDGAGG